MSVLDQLKALMSHISRCVLQQATGWLTSLENITEVPDQQVTKMGKLSIFWLLLSWGVISQSKLIFKAPTTTCGVPPGHILTNSIINTLLDANANRKSGKIPNFMDSELLKTPKTDCALKVYKHKEFYQLRLHVCWPWNSGERATLSSRGKLLFRLEICSENVDLQGSTLSKGWVTPQSLVSKGGVIPPGL